MSPRWDTLSKALLMSQKTIDVALHSSMLATIVVYISKVEKESNDQGENLIGICILESYPKDDAENI